MKKRKCKKIKYLLDFTLGPDNIPYPYCKECNIIDKMTSTKPLDDLKKRKGKNRALIKAFNIDLEEYERMLSYQGGKCAICKRPSFLLDRSLAVDHCHKTGKIRKLLCSRCNLVLGHIDDNIEILESMVKYLTIFNSLHKFEQ